MLEKEWSDLKMWEKCMNQKYSTLYKYEDLSMNHVKFFTLYMFFLLKSQLNNVIILNLF